MSILPRIVYATTRPSQQPIRKITLYYLILFGSVAALARLSPEWFGWLSGWESAPFSVTDDLGNVLVGPPSPGEPHAIAQGQLLYALASALLLMIPVSWGYMSTRMKSGFDQSVVQTMLILPIAVAGIVVVVQNSIALAFSLAGIVAAVRFRNALSDTSDALYIFAAIGVGLACGIGAGDVAVVVSVFFNYVVLVLWHCDYGVCFQAGPLPEYSSGKLLERVGETAQVTAGGRSKKKKKKRDKDKTRVAPPAAEPEVAASTAERTTEPSEPGRES